MVELWNITGWALVPFVISVLYSTTNCGARKIAWYLDFVAMGAAFVVWYLVKSQIHGPLAEAKPLMVLVASFIGYIVIAIFLPVLYKILYAGLPSAHDAGHGPAHH